MTITDDIEAFLENAREALAAVSGSKQSFADDLATAAAWAGYQEENARKLATLAHEETQYGNVSDKVTKIQRKTKGTLADLQGKHSVGLVAERPDQGLRVFAKPVGVVGAVLPATNPAATAINNVVISLKGLNAVILIPHPSTTEVCSAAVSMIHHELARVDAPLDLVQWFDLRDRSKARSRDRLGRIMEAVDLVLATSGTRNVHLAYRSGKPVQGVGVGNAPVIIDETADVADAVAKIVASKTFDYGTSCSSENSIVVHSSAYEKVKEQLQQHGARFLNNTEKDRLQQVMWENGNLNRNLVARSASHISESANISNGTSDPKLLVVEESGVGPDYPFSGEKLSVVLTMYQYKDFEEAIALACSILSYMGKGHSCGIHTQIDQRAYLLAERVPVSTTLVNQPHCLNNGGSFDNGLDFTLSMGAGSWQGNSTCENITYRHLLNYTYLAATIPESEPSDDELWGEYLGRYW